MNSSNNRTPCVRLAVLSLASVIVLAGCGGGSASVGFNPPTVAALGVVVKSGSSNPKNVINASTASSVEIGIKLPADSDASDLITVTLSDGQGTDGAVQSQGSGQAGGGELVIVVDASALADGPIDVTVQSQTASGAAESQFDDVFTKDTTPPELPAKVWPLDAGGAETQYVNIATAPATTVRATFPNAGGGQHTAELHVGVGSEKVVAPAQAYSTAVVDFTGVDLTSLPDGALQLELIVTDPNMNSASMAVQATKDTVAPQGAISAEVLATPFSPANVLNVATTPIAVADVAWGPANDARMLQVRMTDTVKTVTSEPATVAAGGGTSSVGPMDASSLGDGPVTIVAVMTDVAGNETILTGTQATKDTVGPVGPSASAVMAGVSNPANVVNLVSSSTVNVSINWPAASSGTDTALVRIAQGAVSVTSTSFGVPPAGGSSSVTGLNCSALGEGTLVLTVTVTEPSGNTTTIAGAPPFKDTMPPVAPTVARVAGSGVNNQDIINVASVNAVAGIVNFPASAQGNETYTFSLTDFSTTVTSSSMTAPAGGGAVSITNLNCSGLSDGFVTVGVTVSDPAQNTSSMNGPSALKDTVPPVNPTAAHVPAGVSNPADMINSATVLSSKVDVNWPGDAGSVTMSVVLSDGVSSQASPPQALGAGAALVTFSGLDCTPLSDGSVSVTVNVTDPAGNPSAYAGTAATKDTQAPMAPTSAHVMPSGTNPIDVINLQSAPATSCDVAFPAGGNPTDVATITLSDGVIAVSSLAEPASPGGTASYTVSATGLGDGAITFAVNVIDAAGNVTIWSGTPATKDTVAPALLVDPTTALTSSPSQTVTGESEAAAAISISGGSAVASGTANPSARFAVPVALTFNTLNTLTVTASDASGNATVSNLDFTPSPLSIVQDPTAPPVVFVDVTVPSGLSDTGGAAGGSFQDLDNDGDLDLFVGGTNKIWQNDGSGVFTDVTATIGTSLVGGSSAVFADYDNDGDLDLFLVDGSNATLMRNEWIPSGLFEFTDVTAIGAGASGVLAGSFWSDFDQDGDCDLVVSSTGLAGPEVRVNQAGVAFVPATYSAPAISQMFFGVAADIIADGRPDLILADASPSFFYRNDGSSMFTNIAGATSNVSIGQASEAGGVIAADWDNDGDLDVIVAAGGALAPSASCGGCLRANNQIFRNEGTSSFTAMVTGQTVAYLAGIEPSDGWMDLCAGDVDNDGRIDLFVGQANSNRLFLNVGDQFGADGVWEFLEVAAACNVQGLGGTQQLVQMADIDGDGDLDLFAPNSVGTKALFRNDVNNHRNLTVHVRGLGTGPGTASRDGIGSHVDLLDATGTTVLASREISGGRGMGSQDALRAHFGVTPSEIYTVRVRFPSGAVRTTTNVVPRDAVNQTITVNE